MTEGRRDTMRCLLSIVRRFTDKYDHLILLCCLVFATAGVGVYASEQPSEKTVNSEHEIQVTIIPEHSNLEDQTSKLALSLKNMLIEDPRQKSFSINISKGVFVKEDVDGLESESVANAIRRIRDKKGAVRQNEYYVYVRLKMEESFQVASVQVYDSSFKQISTFTVKEIEQIASEQVKTIADRLIVDLSKNIRILVLDLSEMNGGKSSSGLGGILSSILKKGLHRSGRLTLVAMLDEEQKKMLDQYVDKKAARVNKSTLLKPEQQLQPNYIVMGKYKEVKDEIYVEIVCINASTTEIVVENVLVIKPATLSRIKIQMTGLASEMKDAIENNFTRLSLRQKHLAVSGYPPFPATGENRARLMEIIKTISRKLKALEPDNVSIKENFGLVEGFVNANEKNKPWKMSQDLEVDYLISIALDATDRDQLELTVDLFDSSKPWAFVSFTKKCAPDAIEDELKKIVDELLSTQWITISDDKEPIAKERASTEVKYRGLYKPLGFSYALGPSFKRDPGLYLDTGTGLMLDIGLEWNPYPSSGWQVRPLHLRLDLLGSQDDGERIVVGADLMLATVVYGFRPHYRMNPYVGASLGMLGVIRRSSDTNYDARLGAGLLAGLEHTLRSSRKLRYEIGYTSTFEEIPERTLLDGATFGGGRPGGFYFQIGFQHDFKQ